jgi:hypothetical protein
VLSCPNHIYHPPFTVLFQPAALEAKRSAVVQVDGANFTFANSLMQENIAGSGLMLNDALQLYVWVLSVTNASFRQNRFMPQHPVQHSDSRVLTAAAFVAEGTTVLRSERR